MHIVKEASASEHVQRKKWYIKIPFDYNANVLLYSKLDAN